MIIDQKGKLLEAWFRKDGPLIKDRKDQNPYGMDFAIGVEYTQEQKSSFFEIKSLKEYLSATDYQAIKYSEGAITEEEFAPIKERRAQARERINEIEFPEPTLTREQIDAAEKKAMEAIEHG